MLKKIAENLGDCYCQALDFPQIPIDESFLTVNSTATREQRPLKLTPWVSPEEKAQVQATAAETGITTHEWCRRAFDFAATHMHRQQKAT